MPCDSTTTVAVQPLQNGQTIGACGGETLLAPNARKNRLQRKMTKDCYWIGTVLKKILTCSVSREMIIIALFTCLYMKDKVGICSIINCHIQAVTGKCSASLRVFANSLRVVSAMTGSLHFKAPLYTRPLAASLSGLLRFVYNKAGQSENGHLMWSDISVSMHSTDTGSCPAQYVTIE